MGCAIKFIQKQMNSTEIRFTAIETDLFVDFRVLLKLLGVWWCRCSDRNVLIAAAVTTATAAVYS